MLQKHFGKRHTGVGWLGWLGWLSWPGSRRQWHSHGINDDAPGRCCTTDKWDTARCRFAAKSVYIINGIADWRARARARPSTQVAAIVRASAPSLGTVMPSRYKTSNYHWLKWFLLMTSASLGSVNRHPFRVARALSTRRNSNMFCSDRRRLAYQLSKALQVARCELARHMFSLRVF